MRLLLTGAAGFIGFHAAKKLLAEGHEVLGYDNFNDYYDPSHKEARSKVLSEFKNFSMVRANLEDAPALTKAWDKFEPDHVLHLAAQAGVRYSIENPLAYISSNIVGFQNVIELVRHRKVTNFVYASSSSVYGSNRQLPFSEVQEVKSPVSLYAATKLANELVASSYAHLYKIPSTGLRFFTVYGPFSRPDMAIYSFAKLMAAGKPISVFNNGNMVRDFTYVDDIVSGICASLKKPEHAQVYNLGRGAAENLMDMIKYLEADLGIKAKINYLPLQAGDVPETISDVTKAHKNLGYTPKTDLKDGIRFFAQWFRESQN
jgi:UDP-glucuronate 4-epimerase